MATMRRRVRSPSANRPASVKRHRLQDTSNYAPSATNSTQAHSYSIVPTSDPFHSSQHQNAPSGQGNMTSSCQPPYISLFLPNDPLGVGLQSPFPYDSSLTVPEASPPFQDLATFQNVSNDLYPGSSNSGNAMALTPPSSGPSMRAVPTFPGVGIQVRNSTTPDYGQRVTPGFEISDASGAHYASPSASPLSPFQHNHQVKFSMTSAPDSGATLEQSWRAHSTPTAQSSSRQFPRPSQSTPSRSPASKPRCDQCGQVCAESKAVKRHKWEQHEMSNSNFCPLCSRLVLFNSSSTAQQCRQVFECLHCERDGVMLSPEDIVPHFEQEHYHCLSSTGLSFHKRPDDYKNHHGLKNMKKKQAAADPGHSWIFDNALDYAVDNFKIDDGQVQRLRGCDHCNKTYRVLVDFIRHQFDMDQQGEVRPMNNDRAFTKQITNLLESDLVRQAWVLVQQEHGNSGSHRWRCNGSEASSLLRDLEKVAFTGDKPLYDVVRRALNNSEGRMKGTS